jgi:hypothetical protein
MTLYADLEDRRRGCEIPATFVHADLHLLIHLSGDAASPGRALHYLVKPASGGVRSGNRRGEAKEKGHQDDTRDSRDP